MRVGGSTGMGRSEFRFPNCRRSLLLLSWLFARATYSLLRFHDTL